MRHKAMSVMLVYAEAGPLSPQAGRPPLSRDSSTLPRVPSNERLFANTPSKEKPRTAPVMLKPGHKVLSAAMHSGRSQQ